MAGFEDWGEGSEGSEAQSPTPSPAISTQQFTPDKSAGKNLDVHEHANRVNRIVSTYLAASPAQRRAGNTWYWQAHRAAVTVANGENPGIGNNTKAMKRGVYRKPGVTPEHVERAAGAIARLSPSMPAGMNWEHNAQAAYETSKLSDKQADAINRGKPGARYVHGTSSLKHAGEHAIVHAHAISKGDVTPEQDLNQQIGTKGATLDVRKKAGSFYRNIKDPMHSTEVTIDARSAGVAAGQRLGFRDVNEQVGKMQGGRYKDYERAYQDATDIVNQHLQQGQKTAAPNPKRAAVQARPIPAPGHGGAKLLPHQVQATTWLADKADLEHKMTGGTGSVAQGSHLHAGPGGRSASHSDFPMPVGQERTQSARDG
jgi:hypothetical protein